LNKKTEKKLNKIELCSKASGNMTNIKQGLIGLGGFSRFPIFLNGNGSYSYGSNSYNKKFNDYVYNIANLNFKKQKFVAIYSLANLKFKSRFVLDLSRNLSSKIENTNDDKNILNNANAIKNTCNTMALNPELKLKSENLIPDKLFVFPSLKHEEIPTNIFGYGIIIKGVKSKKIFVPLIIRRKLLKNEVDAILSIYNIKIKSLSIEHIYKFLEILGIEVVNEERMADSTFILELKDSLIESGNYKVHITHSGKILNVNFCIDLAYDAYLPELIMLVRNQQSIYIFSDEF